LAIALCFWLKVISALVLTVSIFFWLFIKRRSVHSNEGKRIILGTILGIIIFLLSWIGFSLIFLDKSACPQVFSVLLYYLKTRIITTEHFFLRMAKFLLHSLRIIFWFSPFLLLLFLYILRLIREKYYGEQPWYLSFLGWVSFFYFFSYLIIGGTSWGFPRYYAAILPFFIVLIAIFVAPIIKKFTNRETSVFLVSIIGLSLIYPFLLEDPLLLLNVGFKKAMLFGNMEIFAINFLGQGFFYFVLPVFIVIFFGKTFLNKNFIDKVIVFLFAGIIVSNISMDIRQAKAAHITSYEYGAQGKNERSYEEGFTHLKESLLECAKVAEELDVQILLEAITRYLPVIIKTIEEGIRMIDEVASPSVKLLADTHHMNIEERSITKSIRQAKGYLAHVHFSDSNRLAPGQGHIDFYKIAEALRDIGYEGFVSGEIQPEPDPSTAARLTIELIRSLPY